MDRTWTNTRWSIHARLMPAFAALVAVVALAASGCGSSGPDVSCRRRPRQTDSSPAADDGSAGALQTVRYGNVEFTVPAEWPVYDLGADPSTCVRFDVHAVYLGHPGADMQCPATINGHAASVLVEPLDGAANLDTGQRRRTRAERPRRRSRSRGRRREPTARRAPNRRPRGHGDVRGLPRLRAPDHRVVPPGVAVKRALVRRRGSGDAARGVRASEAGALTAHHTAGLRHLRRAADRPPCRRGGRRRRTRASASTSAARTGAARSPTSRRSGSTPSSGKAGGCCRSGWARRRRARPLGAPRSCRST